MVYSTPYCSSDCSIQGIYNGFPQLAGCWNWAVPRRCTGVGTSRNRGPASGVSISGMVDLENGAILGWVGNIGSHKDRLIHRPTPRRSLIWPAAPSCSRRGSALPTAGCGRLRSSATCGRCPPSSPARTPLQSIPAPIGSLCAPRGEWCAGLWQSTASAPRGASPPIHRIDEYGGGLKG